MDLVKIYKKIYAPLYLAVLVYACFELRKLQLVGTGHLALATKDAHMLSENLPAAIMTMCYGTFVKFISGLADGGPWFQHFALLSLIVGPAICWVVWKDAGESSALVYMFGISMCGSYFFTGVWFNPVAMVLTLAIGFMGVFIIGCFIMASLWTAFIALVKN